MGCGINSPSQPANHRHPAAAKSWPVPRQPAIRRVRRIWNRRWLRLYCPHLSFIIKHWRRIMICDNSRDTPLHRNIQTSSASSPNPLQRLWDRHSFEKRKILPNCCLPVSAMLLARPAKPLPPGQRSREFSESVSAQFGAILNATQYPFSSMVIFIPSIITQAPQACTGPSPTPQRSYISRPEVTF